MHRLRALAASIIVSLLILTGCAGLTGLESPEVSMADIQVLEMKTLETTFLVELRITNPNPEPLTVQGLNCDVALEGKQFAKGVQKVGKTIEPYDSALVEMEVYASMLDIFSSVFNVLQQINEPGQSSTPVGYQLSGKVSVTAGGISHNLPFSSEGELNL